jgi:chorismate mutase
VGCLLIHGVLDSKGTELSRGSCVIHGFFMGFRPGRRSPMKHSVQKQALQALEASDRRIAQLLTLRSQLAIQLAQAAPGQQAVRSLDERVAAVVSRLALSNPGPLDRQRLASLFETVIRLTEPLCGALSTRNGAAKKG